MMLSGPSPGTRHYEEEATLFISRVLDGASINPRSMESVAINREKQEAGEGDRWRERGNEKREKVRGAAKDV